MTRTMAFLKLEEKDSVKKSLTDFGNETTIHGLQYVVNKQNIIYRLCWLGICVAFTVVFLIQGNLILADFLRRPYSTKIDIIGRPSLAFPAVTVCNENMMRRSQMAGTRFQSLLDVDGGVQGADFDYSWFFSSTYFNGYRSWHGASTSSWSGSSISSYGSSSYGQSLFERYRRKASPSTSSVGSSEGSSDGSSVGSSDGSSDGSSVGSSDGSSVGSSDGSSVGSSDGSSYGSSVGSSDGSSVGSSVGSSDGSSVGSSDGSSIGSSGGSSVGSSDGSSVGQSSTDWKDGSSFIGSSSSFSDISSVSSEQFSESSFLPSYSSQQSHHSYFEQWSWYDPSYFEDFQFYSDNWDEVSDPEDWLGFYEASKSDDFSDFRDIVNPTREELTEYGHQLEDFIIQCTFDRRPCNISRDFHVWQNRYFGNCFTFNSDLSERNNIHTGKTGGLNGLHLTLFVEQPEYLGILSPHTGAKVSIHHPNEHPFPEDDALAVPTGQETSIGIRQEYIKRLGGYYTNCTYDGSNTNFSSSEYSYSLSACKKICYQLHLSQLCNCVDNQFFDGYDIKCGVLNRTQQLCRQFVEELYLDDKLPCSCPSPCEEFKYVKTPSSSLWPSERYEEHLSRRLNSSYADLYRILQSNELSRKNLIRVKIYYEDLNYEFIEMVPVYTIPSLLGSVGGLMGLYIGMSFISVFEVLFLVLRLIKISLTRICSRVNQVHPHHADTMVEKV